MRLAEFISEEESAAIAQTAKDLVNPPVKMQHRARRDQEREQTYQNAQRGRNDDDDLDEGTGNIGSKIKALYQKIYDQGDDSIDYMYHESPVFAQIWDEYEGDLDSIIAEVDPSELQVIANELEAYLQGPGLAEMHSDTPKGRYKSNGTRSHSTYGSRDHYNLGDPETTLGPDSVLTAKDVAKKAGKELDKAFDKSHKKGMAEGLNEFAPPGSNDSGNDGFSEETLKRLAAQWYNGDEDPRVERTLMAAGWEIGQDEGYDDEPGVFVVQAGDINGNSYISWPAHELKQGAAGGLNEFSPAGGGGNIPRGPKTPSRGPWGDSGEDPYQLRRYNRSIDFFDQFDSDGVDKQNFDKATGEYEGYYFDRDAASGITQIAYFKFDDPTKIGDNDPGVGWYYEPIDEGVAEGEKIAGRYDPDDWDAMVGRLKKLAGMGPLKTVWDEKKRVYKNVPVAVQPAQQPKKDRQ